MDSGDGGLSGSMNALILRISPMLVGISTYFLFEWQWRVPLAYPWALLAATGLYVVLVLRMVWPRSDRWVMLWNALPMVCFFLAATVCAVMLEESFWRHALSVFTGLTSYMALELLFLHLFHSSRYPVNGLTHLQLGLIPLTNALLAWGLVGVRVFAKAIAPPAWSVPLVFACVNALAFAVTSHPDASPYARRIWILFAAFSGFSIGLLLLFLPLAMPAQAFIAALLIALPLRLRRYGFRPALGLSTALLEGGLALIAFLAVLLLSRWA